MGLFDSVSSAIGPAAIGAGAMLGGPLGAGLAAGGLGFMGTMSTNQANQDIASANNAWSAEQFASRYQTTVKDMEAAGLNPMLAYSQGGGSPPTAQQVQFQNPAAAGIQAFQSAGSGAQAFSSAAQAESTARQADANTEKIIAETKNVPIEGDRLRFTIQLLAEQAAKTAQQTQSETITQRVLTQTIQKLKAETTLLNFDIDAARSLDNLGSESRQFKTIIDLIKAVK